MKKTLLLFLAILVYGGILSAQDTTGLVAYYPFNGDAHDESGHGNNGVVHGSILTTDRFGNPNFAFEFNGIDNYIEAFDSPTLRVHNVTISGWVYFSNIPTGPVHLFGKTLGTGYQESYTIWYSNTLYAGVCNFAGCGIWLTYSEVFLQNKWYHFVFTFDDDINFKQIWVDGIAVSDYPETKSISYDNHPFQIGAEYENEALAYFFPGKLDDIRIYNRAIRDSEVDSLYHEGGWKIQATFDRIIDDKVVCKGDSTIFLALAEGLPSISYQWQKEGVNIPGATDSVFSIANVQPEDGGEYRCIASNSYGIDTSNTATLTVEFAVPTVINGMQNVIEYQEVLYSVPMQPGHINEFLVEGGNEIQSTENTIMVHWGSYGMGHIKLIETSELGCVSDTVTLDVSISHLGINELLERIQFKAIPNPFNSSTTFSYVLQETGQVVIRIYNSFGQIVAEPLNSNQAKGMQNVDWNADKLSAGIYYYRIQVGEMVGNGKVVKW